MNSLSENTINLVFAAAGQDDGPLDQVARAAEKDRLLAFVREYVRA
jgi:hypothetical protein